MPCATLFYFSSKFRDDLLSKNPQHWSEKIYLKCPEHFRILEHAEK